MNFVTGVTNFVTGVYKILTVRASLEMHVDMDIYPTRPFREEPWMQQTTNPLQKLIALRARATKEPFACGLS